MNDPARRPTCDHPTESELADLVAGGLDDGRSDEVADHVAACLACRLLVDRLRHGLPDLPDCPTCRCRRPPPCPRELLAAVAGADRPKAGLERASSGGPAASTAVRRRWSGCGPSAPTEAAAVPVSFDTELADERHRHRSRRRVAARDPARRARRGRDRPSTSDVLLDRLGIARHRRRLTPAARETRHVASLARRTDRVPPGPRRPSWPRSRSTRPPSSAGG